MSLAGAPLEELAWNQRRTLALSGQGDIRKSQVAKIVEQVALRPSRGHAPLNGENYAHAEHLQLRSFANVLARRRLQPGQEARRDRRSSRRRDLGSYSRSICARGVGSYVTDSNPSTATPPGSRGLVVPPLTNKAAMGPKTADDGGQRDECAQRLAILRARGCLRDGRQPDGRARRVRFIALDRMSSLARQQ